MAPKRLKEKEYPAENVQGDRKVQDTFLRGLEAERVLVKNMRRKVRYENLFLLGNIQVVFIHPQVDKMKSQLSPKVGASPIIRNIPQNQPRDFLKNGVANFAPEKGSVQISLLVFKPLTLRGGGTMSKSNSSSSSNSPAVLSPKTNFHREMKQRIIHPTKNKEQRTKA